MVWKISLIKHTIVCFFFTVSFAKGMNSGGIYSSELCLDCLENTTVSRCTLPFCHFSSDCNNTIDLGDYSKEMQEPSLVCQDENSLTLSWNQQGEMYYLIEYSIRESNESKFTELTRCNHVTINGLNSNENYDIYLFGLSLEKKAVYRSHKREEKTPKSMKERTPVVNLTHTLSFTEKSYMATVKWEPGPDFSCTYELLWYSDQELGEYINRRINLKKQLKTEYNLTNLGFGKKYKFSIMSIDRISEKESSSEELIIEVPSCEDTFKNLSVCPPKPPIILTVELQNNHSETAIVEGNQTDVTVTWIKPELEPDFYNITLFSYNKTSKGKSAFIVSGDQNSALLENVYLGEYNLLRMVAHSKGGKSTSVYIREIPYPAVDNASIFTDNSSISPDITVISNDVRTYMQLMWIALTIILFVVLILAFGHKLKKSVTSYMVLKGKTYGAAVRYAIGTPEDSKWELAESKLIIDKVVGCGAFGIVQKGYYLEPNKKIDVAVKTLKAKPTGEQIAQFYDEIEIMKSVPRHTHIVYLIGVITKRRPNNPLMLVEYCSRGNLQSFLRKVSLILGESDKSEVYTQSEHIDDATTFFNKSYYFDKVTKMDKNYILESKDLLSFARQIVVGMEFLSNLKVIHRDLAARNVLISVDNTLKISDFGLSRDIYTDNIYKKVTAGKLPFRWMALESLTHQVYTTESDVWSFGIVLWEIVTLGGNPYPTIKPEDLVALLKSGYRMEKPINCSEELYQIMFSCWQTSPNLRATFKDLRQIFDTLLESEMQYISLEDARKLDQAHYENIKDEKEDNIEDGYMV